MGGMGTTAPAATPASTPVASPGSAASQGLSKEFEANKPQIMPVYNSPAQVESAKRKRQELIARSGRGATNLTGNPGTRAYSNSFLGSVT
jgi:hypothetical protein